LSDSIILEDSQVNDPPLFAIETDLTEEEIKLLEQTEKNFEEHPEDFITLDDYLAGKIPF